MIAVPRQQSAGPHGGYIFVLQVLTKACLVSLIMTARSRRLTFATYGSFPQLNEELLKRMC